MTAGGAALASAFGAAPRCRICGTSYAACTDSHVQDDEPRPVDIPPTGHPLEEASQMQLVNPRPGATRTKAIWVDRTTPSGDPFRTKIRIPVDADEDEARAAYLATVEGANAVPGVVSVTSTKAFLANGAPPVQTGEDGGEVVDPAAVVTPTQIGDADPVEANLGERTTDPAIVPASGTVTAGGDDIETPGADGPGRKRTRRS